jgi:hypothetical protein
MIGNMPAHVLFAFLSISVIAVFSFVGVVSRANTRRMEREAYYKADMLKKIAESPAGGAEAALELYREEQRVLVRQKREGLRIGGFVLMAVGVGLAIFLGAVGGASVATCGALRFLIGVTLLASSVLGARGEESGEADA